MKVLGLTCSMGNGFVLVRISSSNRGHNRGRSLQPAILYHVTNYFPFSSPRFPTHCSMIASDILLETRLPGFYSQEPEALTEEFQSDFQLR